jgi:hypothetical protein
MTLRYVGSWAVAMTLSHAHDDARTGPVARAIPVDRGKVCRRQRTCGLRRSDVVSCTAVRRCVDVTR